MKNFATPLYPRAYRIAANYSSGLPDGWAWLVLNGEQLYDEGNKLIVQVSRP